MGKWLEKLIAVFESKIQEPMKLRFLNKNKAEVPLPKPQLCFHRFKSLHQLPSVSGPAAVGDAALGFGGGAACVDGVSCWLLPPLLAAGGGAAGLLLAPLLAPLSLAFGAP